MNRKAFYGALAATALVPALFAGIACGGGGDVGLSTSSGSGSGSGEGGSGGAGG